MTIVSKFCPVAKLAVAVEVRSMVGSPTKLPSGIVTGLPFAAVFNAVT